MNDLCILLPIYKQNLYDYEQLSLYRLIDFCKTNNYLNNLLIICAENFDIDKFCNTYIEKFNIQNINYMTFNDKYFLSVNTFNNGILLSYQFYNNFDQKYIFTYQLDGYIFDNYFDYFINKDYEYIGGYVMPLFSHISKLGVGDGNIYMNGGISLRKPKFCQEAIANPIIQKYINGCEHILNQHILDEDYVYSCMYKKPVNALDSLAFSFNYTFAENAYEICGKHYPFCCHGIQKNQFLMKLINQYNKENNLTYF